ncbi:hypothetical protein VTJ04DRAFT_8597 [Mycothermus thermophilus]|uniref:uncharacterized protein n=1 Tax=Humicola insolens TaxID=85995 RepID=UPI0037438919
MAAFPRSHPHPNPNSNPSSNAFNITPSQLTHLTDPKSLPSLIQLGGLPGLAASLQTNLQTGLPSSSSSSSPSPDTRRAHFGANTLPPRPAKSFLALAWLALQDRVLVLLCIAAAISLALGLYQTFDGHEPNPVGDDTHGAEGVEWIEGVAIIVAITVVVLVGALNDWQKERQFRRLSQKRDDRDVTVIRDGGARRVGVQEVMVGDLVGLETGDVIPVDGVLVEGHNVACDEASATGESDLVKKMLGQEAVERFQALMSGQGQGNERERMAGKIDPFLLSGARVLDGVGTFLVTAVGQNSNMGRTMMALREDPGMTPLQARLSVLAGYIAKLGSAAGLLLFTVLFIEFLARLPGSTESAEKKGQTFLRILMTAITIVVVAVPEGLPLAVTLSLAFATKKMTRENNLVRHLQSCETMGNATVICSDKTGTLTQNVMTVVGGSLGKGSVTFGEGPLERWHEDHNTGKGQASRDQKDTKKVEEGETGNVQHQEQQLQHYQHVPTTQLSSVLPADLTTLLRESVAINTTAFEGGDNTSTGTGASSSQPTYIGTKTETSLLDWARKALNLGPLATERTRHPFVAAIPFNSRRKCMGSVIELAPAPGVIRSDTTNSGTDSAGAGSGNSSPTLVQAPFPQLNLPEDEGESSNHPLPGPQKPRYRLFVKGAPEVILAQCRSVANLSPDTDKTHQRGDISSAKSSNSPQHLQLQLQPLLEADKKIIESTTSHYATLSLRTLALAYRDLDTWPPSPPRPQSQISTGPFSVDDDNLSQSHLSGEEESQPITENQEEDSQSAEDLLASLALQDLTFLGIVAIQDPVRAGVPEAVASCHRASVDVKMVTGDKVETARAIARECGIIPAAQPGFESELEDDGQVMEGAEFRRLSGPAQLEAARRLKVLARSSPEDKRVLVTLLKTSGEVVAVTGDGTNDAAALRAADVGFSMGIAGTEVAKEASDIVLMDDNFASIVKALAWGRAINDSVKKFLQFQITVNITAVILTFISAVASSEERSVLSAVQLLWVNLIMDTFAALALATDPPTGSLLDREPEPRRAPLITVTMWKMILGQSLYQLVVCLTLHFAGPEGRLGFLYPPSQQRTLVFNTFVFMQIFKLINSRRIDNKLNIFEGLHKNHLFQLMMSIMIAGQVLIVSVGDKAFGVVRPTAGQWGIALVLGFMSIPVGILIRLVPDAWVAPLGKLVPRSRWVRAVFRWPWCGNYRRLFKRRNQTDVESPENNNNNGIILTDEDDSFGAVMVQVRDDLAFLKRLRGGRLKALGEELLARSPSRGSLRRRLSGSKSQDEEGRRFVQQEELSAGKKQRPRRRTHNRQKSFTHAAVGMPGLLAASIAARPAVSREGSARGMRLSQEGEGEGQGGASSSSA